MSETNTLSETDIEKRGQVPGLPKAAESDASSRAGAEPGADPYEVQLDPEDDPKRMPSWRKWVAVIVISCASLCATFASSVVRLPGLTPECERRVLIPRVWRYRRHSLNPVSRTTSTHRTKLRSSVSAYTCSAWALGLCLWDHSRSFTDATSSTRHHTSSSSRSHGPPRSHQILVCDTLRCLWHIY